MRPTSRRNVLRLAAALPLATCSAGRAAGRNRPYVHVTDCFRPHRDPDDHWDLATVYALAWRGDIDLKAIVLDAPWKWKSPNTPDVMAVAMMNRITGLSVPVVTGTPRPMSSRTDTQPDLPPDAHGAVRLLQQVLSESPSPVAINITGGATDVAIAALPAPALFREKCAGVYVSSGVGAREESRKGVEHNVAYDPAAYAALFDLPCPLYWAATFENFLEGSIGLEKEYPAFWRKPPANEDRIVEAHGTWYRFRQDAILPHLSPRVQNFFTYMFEQAPGPHWLQYLNGPVHSAVIEEFGRQYRNMWSTAAILSAGGLCVDRSGNVLPKDSAGENALFTFDGMTASCDDRGVTSWSPDPDARDRFIIHVHDTGRYAEAMTHALKSLVMELP